MPIRGYMGTASSLSSSYLQSMLNTVLQNSGLAAKTTGSGRNGIGASTSASQTDNQQLSPFAQVITELQQLQQTDPTKYQQVTQQIATNLQSAAQTAQADGNSTAANQLNQLATDFTNASKSGQLPNMQDLAQAIGGHHHRHSHGGGADADASSSADGSSSDSSSSTASSGSAATRASSQLLSAFQANGSSDESLNPMTIILNTLSTAGIGSSNS